jgi:hypothetical protein
MFLFPHNVANWTPFFFCSNYLFLYLSIYIIYTTIFVCHQNMWEKKKKDATNPSYLGFFLGSVWFRSVWFDSVLILFYFILFDWGSEHSVPTMKMIIYL